MMLRGMAFAIITFCFTGIASAQLCNVSEAHMAKLTQTFAGMKAGAAATPAGQCGIDGIISNFQSQWQNPAVCGPEDVKQTCVSDVENAITQNMPQGGFKTGGCDTQKQAKGDMDSRGKNMGGANSTCEKKFIARRESCRNMFKQTFGKVARCSVDEISQAEQVMMQTAREGLKLYCQIINSHVKGLATQAKIEATSEKMNSRTIAKCNN